MTNGMRGDVCDDQIEHIVCGLTCIRGDQMRGASAPVIDEIKT